MNNPKDILVITTSASETLKVKKYLKPVSAHVVAGTNLFSDFFGGLTDVFGGRSYTYQKQLRSLYNEAIDKIKNATYEIGGNCVIGLNIDMDEISGKGKSMFMLTAVGTAVIIEKEQIEINNIVTTNEKFENVGVERINQLKAKRNVIEKANNNTLILNEEDWNIIISNQITEIFPFIIKKYSSTISNIHYSPEVFANFNKNLTNFLENLGEEKSINLLYAEIKNENKEDFATKLSEIIKELNLYDYENCMGLLKSNNFVTQKIGLKIMKFDKSFYNKTDVENLQTSINFINRNFKERGIRSMKKQMLSSKEKEVWTCECSKVNDIETNCQDCTKDIYGFTLSELKPKDIINILEQKIILIKEYLQ